MAMQQLTLPGNFVKKDNRLIRSKINITSQTAGRILASLIACVRYDDREFKGSYSIATKNYIPDDSGRGYKRIKDACKELLSAHVEIENSSSNSNTNPKLKLMPFFSVINYEEGIITASFNSHMADFLLMLQELFTEYNLIDYLKLPSIYSQRIFEILKSWDDKPEKSISLSELHRMLNTPESLQKNFAQFRRWVLEKAHKDIHEKTSLRFEWEPVKAGRSVESIRFLFSPSRKAIAAEETNKAKEAKKKRLETQRISRALECAKAKKGECDTQDNKRLVCKMCLQWKFCDDLRRHGGKPFDPRLTVAKE